MRLAYLCADRGIPIDGVKGASIHVRAVARALHGRGHELTLLAARPGAAPLAETLPVVDVGFDRTLKEIKRAAAGIAGGERLAAEGLALLLNVRAAEELEALHRRQPLDALYERYSLWSWAGLRFARRHGLPLVLEVNAPLVSETGRWRELELAPLALALQQRLLRDADAVVVPSRELAEWLTGEIGRRGLIRVIPNGFDDRLFRHPGPLPLPADRLRDRFVIVFTGSLKPWHGVEVLLAAFERLAASVPEAHLLVVGDGPLRGRVDEAAARLGDGRMTVTGAVDHGRIPGWLACADVGVAPYPELDSFYFSPLKVIEYQAAGLPVVASSCGQLRELVLEGRTGHLVPPGDPERLAEALAALHADPRERRRKGRRARERAWRASSWSAVAARTEEVIRRCQARSQPAARPAGALAGGGG